MIKIRYIPRHNFGDVYNFDSQKKFLFLHDESFYIKNLEIKNPHSDVVHSSTLYFEVIWKDISRGFFAKVSDFSNIQKTKVNMQGWHIYFSQ